MSRSIDPSIDGRRTSRRRFVQILGAAAAVTPFAGAMQVAAQTAAPTSTPTPTPAPTPTAPPAAAAPEDPDLAADARSITEMIQRRYGARLDATQLKAVEADVQSTLGAGRTLRKLDVRNADEPDVAFRARPLESGSRCCHAKSCSFPHPTWVANCAPTSSHRSN
jgi:hypothetical protein